MTTDAYREMAGDALRATRQRGDAAMARYFGEAALAALAKRMRLLRHAAGQQMSFLYKLPQAGAKFVEPTAADRSGQSRAWIGAAHPVTGIALRSAMAASAGARGHLTPAAAMIGKTPLSSALLPQPGRAAAGLPLAAMRTAVPNGVPARPAMRTAMPDGVSARAAVGFGGLTMNPGLRATANHKPAVGNSFPATRFIAGRLTRVIHAVSAASAHAGIGAAQTLGFGQTVRPAVGAPAAGNVFLDKNLVGYHLAAAITAEQTRAAGRPNGSGAGFNGSMAALRPSGAGL